MISFDPAKPLKLSITAEKALLDLVLNYELNTGIRVNWRKKPSDVFEMVKNALNSDVGTLAVKAWAFVDASPNEFKLQFPQKTLIKEKPADRNMTYRGVSTGPTKKQGASKEAQDPSKKRRMYRGVAID